MNNIAGILIIVLLVIGLLTVGGIAGVLYTIPQCQEDQALLGVGDFNKGRWTSYECGPAADDYALADVNGDGAVNVLDVQTVVNAYLGEIEDDTH